MPVGAAVVYSADYTCDIGPHVFPMSKFRLVRDELVAAGDVAGSAILEPAPATAEELARVHTREYLEDLEHLRWTERTMYSELPLERDIVRAYVLAAGGTLLAAREALTRGAGINLGGGFHHAGPGRAEGFCYINDLAVAVRALQHERRVRRAAVVDLDVHQGNGTHAIFAGDTSVFAFSMHGAHNYPFTRVAGDLDIDLADGTGDDEYLARLQGALPGVLAAARADLVCYLAGADPLATDALGRLSLTPEGLARRDAIVLESCREIGLPVCISIAGGYSRPIEHTVSAHLATVRVASQFADARASGAGVHRFA
jgi:acetoin utilization deacetylase AcuC-like enzyme